MASVGAIALRKAQALQRIIVTTGLMANKLGVGEFTPPRHKDKLFNEALLIEGMADYLDALLAALVGPVFTPDEVAPVETGADEMETQPDEENGVETLPVPPEGLAEELTTPSKKGRKTIVGG